MITHSSASNEHYTPSHIVQAARSTLGRIHLDPASCEEAQKEVQADTWLGRGSPFGEDGLTWEGTAHGVFLNPPGGRAPADAPTRSMAALWWYLYSRKWYKGEIKNLVFVAFNLEILRSTQGLDCPQPMRYPFCVPSKRLRFVSPGGKVGTSPAHANAILYLGDDVRRFRRDFGPFGMVRI